MKKKKVICRKLTPHSSLYPLYKMTWQKSDIKKEKSAEKVRE